MKKGWIKLYRSITDCDFWNTKEPYDRRSAWVDILLTVNHEEKKIIFNNEVVTVERGQMVTSVRKLSEKWKWSRDRVATFLRTLERTQMLTVNSNRYRTLLTVVNYDKFQSVPDTESATNTTTSQPQTRTQLSHQQGTNKNIRTFKKKDIKAQTQFNNFSMQKSKKDYEEIERLITQN